MVFHSPLLMGGFGIVNRPAAAKGKIISISIFIVNVILLMINFDNGKFI